MIRAILWKEYREHRAIWLALAIVGGAGLYGLWRLLVPASAMTPREGPIEPVVSVAVLLAWAYGLVCGSMLLAGEREGATMTFLDMMPMRRLHLWLVKSLFGLVVLLGQVMVLTGFVIGLGITGNTWQTAGIVAAMLLSGLFGMAWGLLFSARGENVLNVIGLAILGQIVAGLAASFLCFAINIFWRIAQRRDLSDPTVYVLLSLVGVGLTLSALVGSARIFSRPDRLRGRAASSTHRPTKPSAWASWIALLWLTYTRMRRLIIGLMLFSLGLGFVLPVAGAVAWAILTLLIGVLCGVTVCDDEQTHGSFRFLGDQRFPPGCVWIVRLGMRFALAIFAAFLLLLPSLIVGIFHQMESPLTERLPPFFSEVLHSSLVGTVVPADLFLSMWLLYGFSVGQLSALLFRKSVVAIVVSLGVSALLVSIWIPSLLSIGLHLWQIAGVPLVLLLMGWTLVPAWTANRLMTRRTFVGLGATFLAVVLLIAVGLWYRVAEVPDLPDQWDMPAFVASIPSPEENKAGQIIRSVCTKIADRERSLRPPQPNPPNWQPESMSSQVSDVPERGWPKDKPELAEWLDAMFQDNWLAELAEIPDLPLGVLEDPRRLTIGSSFDKTQGARLLTVVLAARGLQRQMAGDNEVFANNLRIGLAISRNLQHDAPLVSALVGQAIEWSWLSALDHWLEKLRGHPQLLKRVLRTLLRHEAELPDERECWQADYLIFRNTLEEAPEQLINHGIHNPRHPTIKLSEAEIQGTVLAWQFPWERERHQRILRLRFQGDEQQRRKAHEWGGIIFAELPFNLKSLSRRKRNLARLHASQLEVALRLYQAETGKPATTLDVLVPRYLPAIPVDPFDGQPFHYRLSKGENLQWELPANAAGGPPPAPTRFIPKGQGILWTVGEDGRDDGGVRQSMYYSNTRPGEDLLYLVPLPAK